MCVRTRRSPRAMTCSRFGGHRLAHSDRSLNRPSNDPRRLIETDCRRDPRSRPARDPRVWAPSASREARSDSRPNSRMAWHIAGFSFRRSCQPLRPIPGRSGHPPRFPTLAIHSYLMSCPQARRPAPWQAPRLIRDRTGERAAATHSLDFGSFAPARLPH